MFRKLIIVTIGVAASAIMGYADCTGALCVRCGFLASTCSPGSVLISDNLCGSCDYTDHCDNTRRDIYHCADDSGIHYEYPVDTIQAGFCNSGYFCT